MTYRPNNTNTLHCETLISDEATSNVYAMQEDGNSPGINAFANWMGRGVMEGAGLYYVNFMFNPLEGSRADILRKMEKAMERFYGKFCTLFSPHPRAPSERKRLPEFWLFPDLPVYKKRKAQKATIEDVTINGGLHYNGAMLVRTQIRSGEGVLRHFKSARLRYAQNGIRRIHIVAANCDFNRLADYAAKTVKTGRAGIDEILILPRSVSEFSRSTARMSDDQRRSREMQSAFNLSPETAWHLLVERKT
jgi:hypothetical protein